MKHYKHILDPTTEILDNLQRQGWRLYSEENQFVVIQSWFMGSRRNDISEHHWVVTLIKEDAE